MRTEEQLVALRAHARRLRDMLQGLLARLPPAGRASPGELTVRLNDIGTWPCGAMFVYAACTAVAHKYAVAGRPRVAEEVMGLRGLAAEICAGDRGPSPLDRPPDRTGKLRLGIKRIWVRATRADFGDNDLRLCSSAGAAFPHAATAWACQQPDWRYRWTPKGATRLRFLADCCDAYSRCDFAPEDWLIGHDGFPLSNQLRPEPCP